MVVVEVVRQLRGTVVWRVGGGLMKETLTFVHALLKVGQSFLGFTPQHPPPFPPPPSPVKIKNTKTDLARKVDDANASHATRIDEVSTSLRSDHDRSWRHHQLRPSIHSIHPSI